MRLWGARPKNPLRRVLLLHFHARDHWIDFTLLHFPFLFPFFSVGGNNRLFLAISCPLSVFLGSQGTNGEQGTWKSFFYDKGKQDTNV